MITANELAIYLDTYLEKDRFKDYCPNGLQIDTGEKINKVALGVSANLEFFKKAKKWGAQALIVHHGLFWNKMSYCLTGVHGKRVQYLFDHKMSLYGYHLPLDYHPIVGNNATIADSLDLKNRSTFANHGGVDIGLIGSLKQSMSFKDVEKILCKFFGQINYAYNFGKKRIKIIAMVSGGAANDIYEAHERGADLYISGEASEQTQEWCREAKMNFIGAGHYASEQFGVQALGKVISKDQGLTVKFFPVQNNF